MCPLFLRYLIHSYCNKKMRIKWNAAISDSFDTSNGVNPLLHAIRNNGIRFFSFWNSKQNVSNKVIPKKNF